MLPTAHSQNGAQKLKNGKMRENFKDFSFLSDLLFKSVAHPISVSMPKDGETAENLYNENRGCLGYFCQSCQLLQSMQMLKLMKWTASHRDQLNS
jgi:hypothetical protein